VDATTYPNHIGHLESKGCFRCHSGRHKSSTGEGISSSCSLCHSIVEQGPGADIRFTNLKDNMEFVHPTAIRETWKKNACSDCHHNMYN